MMRKDVKSVFNWDTVVGRSMITGYHRFNKLHETSCKISLTLVLYCSYEHALLIVA